MISLAPPRAKVALERRLARLRRALARAHWPGRPEPDHPAAIDLPGEDETTDLLPPGFGGEGSPEQRRR